MGIWDTVYTFLKDFQTLIAGVLAICAALIAYRGAVRQAGAAVKAVEANHEQARRAAAAGFIAELTECRLTIMALQLSIQAATDPSPREIVLPELDTVVFDANPAAIGLLPATEAHMVAVLYKTIRVTAGEFRAHNAGNQRFDIGRLRDRASRIEKMIDGGVRLLRSSANIGLAETEYIAGAADRAAMAELAEQRAKRDPAKTP